MTRLHRRRALLGLPLLAAGLGRGALAADLTGVWVVDKVAWEREMDRVIAKVLGGIPPAALQAMRAQGMDPTATMKAQALEGMNGEVSFLPDGRVRAVLPDRVEDGGRWSLSGDILTVEVPRNEAITAMRGPVGRGRIELRPVLRRGGPPGAAFLADMVVPLIRR